MFKDSFFRAIIDMPSIIRLPASRGVEQVRKERNRSNPGGRRRNRGYQILAMTPPALNIRDGGVQRRKTFFLTSIKGRRFSGPLFCGP